MEPHQLFMTPDGYSLSSAVYDGVAVTLVAPAAYERIFVYLHGNGGTSASWTYVHHELLELDRSSAHAFIDLPNHGSSARSVHPNQPIDQQKFLLQIQQAIEHVIEHRPKEVVIVGHCLGGMIAQLLIRANPSFYTHAVLINAGSKIPAFLNLFTVAPFPWLIHLTELYWPASWYIQKDLLLKKKRYVHDIDIPRLFFDIRSVGAKYYFQIGKFIQKTSFENVPQEITQPVLIIAGEKDVYYSKSTTTAFVQKFRCATLLLIKNSGHMAIFNNQKEVARAIAAFLHL